MSFVQDDLSKSEGVLHHLITLSDDDLRYRLEVEFAFTCGPITESTRSVYLNKLVKLIEKKKTGMSDIPTDSQGILDTSASQQSQLGVPQSEGGGVSPTAVVSVYS